MINHDVIKAINKGQNITEFRTNSGLVIANNCIRVVIGGRGPYIEFNSTQIITDNIHVPKEELYRLKSNNVYYDEYRTNDVCNVKIYYQKNVVKYADYKIGMWYISPYELVCNIEIKKTIDFFWTK